jgi:hypothetical protein
VCNILLGQCALVKAVDANRFLEVYLRSSDLCDGEGLAATRLDIGSGDEEERSYFVPRVRGLIVLWRALPRVETSKALESMYANHWKRELTLPRAEKGLSLNFSI